MQRFEADSDINLQVRFFWPAGLAPAAGADTSGLRPFIVARELQDLTFYWMESKALKFWESEPRPGRWNSFKPWPTSAVLRNLMVPSDNLGVSVFLDASWRVLAPAFVYHLIPPPPAVREYLLHLRPGFTFESGMYRLYQTRGDRDEEVSRGSFGPKPEGVPFVLRLDASRAKRGWLKVKIDAYYKGTVDGIGQEYLIYHSPSTE